MNCDKCTIGTLEHEGRNSLGPQAFAAGADIKEMQHRDFASNYRENFLEWWSNITLVR